MLKIECFSCKSGSPLGGPVGTKRGLKMVENTSKMMLRASKIDQGMAKIITQKLKSFEKFFIFSAFANWTLQRWIFVSEPANTPQAVRLYNTQRGGQLTPSKC